jgi:hypothetical protein
MMATYKTLDSVLFQEKGGLRFNWIHIIQKKPKEKGISLRQKGAFKLDTRVRSQEYNSYIKENYYYDLY